eukprot:2266687-Prymnesium_polylepis.1
MQLVATPPLASKPVCTHAQVPMAWGVICQTHFLPPSCMRAPGCPNAGGRQVMPANLCRMRQRERVDIASEYKCAEDST